MATTPYVDPWAVQPDQSLGKALSVGLVGAYSDNLNALANPPRVKARRTATQTITTSTFTAVSFTASDLWDTDGFHSTLSNETKIIVPAGLGGTYLINAVATLASGSTGWTALIELYVNGSSVERLLRINSNANPDLTMNGSSELQLAAGDELELYVWHNKGSDTTVNSARLSARLVAWS